MAPEYTIVSRHFVRRTARESENALTAADPIANERTYITLPSNKVHPRPRLYRWVVVRMAGQDNRV